MKLEYLPDGAPDCPLIRLYDFDRSQAVRLRELARALSTGELHEANLEKEEYLEAIGGCQLVLRRADRDRGVKATGPFSFACSLSAEGWSKVFGLLGPFSEGSSNGFKWLTARTDIALLISKDGRW